MKKLKRVITALALVLCLCLPLTLVACGESKGDDKKKSTPATKTAEQVLTEAYQNSLNYKNLMMYYLENETMTLASFDENSEVYYSSADGSKYYDEFVKSGENYTRKTYDVTQKKYIESTLTKQQKALSSHVILNYVDYYNAAKVSNSQSKESVSDTVLKNLFSVSDLNLTTENGKNIVSFDVCKVNKVDETKYEFNRVTFKIYIEDGLVEKLTMLNADYNINENKVVETEVSNSLTATIYYSYTKDKLVSLDKEGYTKA